MNRLVAATLLTFVASTASLVFTPQAQAQVFGACYGVPETNVIRNPGDHPGAYADGYSEGRRNQQQGKPYKPRSAGGEFARGFDDGYYKHPFKGQDYAVRDRVEYYASTACDSFYPSYVGSLWLGYSNLGWRDYAYDVYRPVYRAPIYRPFYRPFIRHSFGSWRSR